MTNQEIVEKFIGGRTSGKSNSMFIDGDVLYSYGYHFPLLRRIPDGTYMINEDRYSRTTSRHQSLCRGCLWTKGLIFRPFNTEQLKAYKVDRPSKGRVYSNELYKIVNDL